MRRSLTLALVLLPALAGATSPVIAIEAGRLLDVANEKVLENVVIVVENGRVREIATTVPAGASVIDLGRYHVLPGFIDGHTHVLLQGDATAADYDAQLLKESLPYRALRAARAMRIALDHGFTTRRDIGNEGAGFVDVDLKRAVAAGVVAGPRLFVATKALAPTGAYGLSGYDWQISVPKGVEMCDGADDCRRAVRDQIAHGADWIKVYADRSYYKQPDGQIRSLPNFTVEEMSFGRALKAGVPIVLGTDAGGFDWDKINQAEEFGRYVALGMTPWQALRSGTVTAAAMLGQEGTLGVIAPGSRADIVALLDNPLQNITATERVSFVMKDGLVVRGP